MLKLQKFLFINNIYKKMLNFLAPYFHLVIFSFSYMLRHQKTKPVYFLFFLSFVNNSHLASSICFSKIKNYQENKMNVN